MAATLFHLLLFAFVIVAGFTKGHFHNLTKPSGFAPYGARGVFEGAAIVYFSYIGYDSVSTLAEEIKHPAQSLPLGVSGSVIIVSIVYCLVALALCILVPYNQISTSAAFSEAFKKSVGWSWGSNVVGVGAALGILTSLLVAMLGQARYLCVFGRAHLIPSWFARVHPTTGTPMNATLCLGVCTAAIALFTELSIVLNMISIGTLVVFYVVANALIYHRHVNKGTTKPLATVLFLVLFSTSAAGFALFWQLEKHSWWGLFTFGILSVVLVAGFKLTVPVVHHPKDWGVPLMPWFPAASIFLNVFLLSTLDRQSYVRFGLWTVFLLLFYIFFSVHATHDAEASSKRDQATTMQVVHNKELEILTGGDD